ncbi:hypothetical protein AAG570_003617 [Ranatra chinensis]|uniref:DAGKc domain-containing protein n=1 Tax=Ranatra chinensis TaxID=642074 RepID=A0ABD0YIL3_9HEMI
MMRAYCEQAMKYGDKPLILGEKHRRITVILNPAANRRKAKKYFEKYCAPLLYLSGVYVSILETEREGHARQIIDKIDPQSDAIVVAGGDGTLSETLTGLMRMKGELCRIPIGVLPLGRTNTLANTIFSRPKDQTRAQMAEATMAIIKGNTRPVNALRIEVLDQSDKGDQKPVYGVTGLEWGAWHDLKKRQQNFWYLGKTLGGYASLLFPGAETLARSLKATVRYTLPCDGCNQCYQQRPDLADNSIPKSVPSSGTRWWSRLSQLQRRPVADLKQGNFGTTLPC